MCRLLFSFPLCLSTCTISLYSYLDSHTCEHGRPDLAGETTLACQCIHCAYSVFLLRMRIGMPKPRRYALFVPWLVKPPAVTMITTTRSRRERRKRKMGTSVSSSSIRQSTFKASAPSASRNFRLQVRNLIASILLTRIYRILITINVDSNNYAVTTEYFIL